MVSFIRPSQLDLAQQARGRQSTDLAIAGLPKTRNRNALGINYDKADNPSPQRFLTAPVALDAINSSAVGIDTAWPSLPGRPAPVGWDGEPGASSPLAGF